MVARLLAHTVYVPGRACARGRPVATKPKQDPIDEEGDRLLREQPELRRQLERFERDYPKGKVKLVDHTEVGRRLKKLGVPLEDSSDASRVSVCESGSDRGSSNQPRLNDFRFRVSCLSTAGRRMLARRIRTRNWPRNLPFVSVPVRDRGRGAPGSVNQTLPTGPATEIETQSETFWYCT